jgi:hypothetical protein
MGVTDAMSGQVRLVSLVPKGQADQGRETLVRGVISKGRFVQGAQHPRTFGRGHIIPASTMGHLLPVLVCTACIRANCRVPEFACAMVLPLLAPSFSRRHILSSLALSF